MHHVFLYPHKGIFIALLLFLELLLIVFSEDVQGHKSDAQDGLHTSACTRLLTGLEYHFSVPRYVS